MLDVLEPAVAKGRVAGSRAVLLVMLLAVCGLLLTSVASAYGSDGEYVDDASAVSTGGYSCAIRGEGQVACWGNWFWSGHHMALHAVPLPGLDDATQVSVGGINGCALRETGEVACFGPNNLGQRGNGTTDYPTEVFEPVAGLSDAVQVSSGADFSCALRSSGQVVCWGVNDQGQLGDGTTTNRPVPTPVVGVSDATSVSAGSTNTCAIRESGQAVCWGPNQSGQLGDGTTQFRATAVDVVGLTDAIDISVGGWFSCAIRESGETVCWGFNAEGALGDGTTVNRSSATPVPGLSDAVKIEAGSYHACAIRASNQAVCWGANFWGGIGDGTTTRRTEPTPVSGLHDAATIAPGTGRSCAVRTNSDVLCWGNGEQGELGDGTTQTRLTPVRVRALLFKLIGTKSGDGDGSLVAHPLDDVFVEDVFTCAATCEMRTAGSTELIAYPDPDSEFIGWTGDCSGTDPSCVLEMDGDKQANAEFRALEDFPLVVNKIGTGSGYIDSFPARITCGSICQTEMRGAITLYASPDNGSEFVGWSGACSGTGACAVTMDQARTVNAEFHELPRYQLSVTKAGDGGGWVQTPYGSLDCGTVCTAEMNGMAEVRAHPEPDSRVASWSGVCAGSTDSCLVPMDQARSITVTFELLPAHTLTATKSGTGSGRVLGGGYVDCGQHCTVPARGWVYMQAFPSRDSEFVGWSGDCSGMECNLTMDGPRQVDAEFRLWPRHLLSIDITGSGNATIYGDDGIQCRDDCEVEIGGTVTLSAVPSGTTEFVGWSDECDRVWDNHCEITMDEPRQVEVELFQPQRKVTVAKGGNGQGTVSTVVSEFPGIDCGAVCEAWLGDTVYLRAQADPDSKFAGWSGACTGLGYCILPFGDDVTVNATFLRKELPPGTEPPQPQLEPPVAPGGGQVHIGTQTNPDSGETFYLIGNQDIQSFPGGCMPLDVSFALDPGSGTISNVSLRLADSMYTASEASPGNWRATIDCVQSGDLWVTFTLTENGVDHVYTVPLGGIVLIDPQGVVYDKAVFDAARSQGKSVEEARAAAAITGATVTLQRSVDGQFVNVPSGDPGISPKVNPQITGNDGLYQWDVSEGTYRVVVIRDGYVSVTSHAVDIPPPVLDLHIAMTRIPTPEHRLSVSKSGNGRGAVSSSPAGIDCGSDCDEQYEQGKVISLSASPEAGSSFQGWSGACSGKGACQVTMSEAKSVTATFALNQSPPPPPPGKPAFGALKVAPKSKTVKRGKKVAFKVQVRNIGKAGAKGAKVCAAAPRKILKVSKCVSLGSLAAGGSKTAKVVVTVQRKAKKGKKAKVSFTAVAAGTGKKTATATVKVG